MNEGGDRVLEGKGPVPSSGQDPIAQGPRRPWVCL